jgi:LysM repeat protein
MSTPQQGEGGGGRAGGFFTRKLGPLPVWGWTALVAGLFLLYSLYKSKQSSTSSTAQSASTVNQPGGVDASLVPQFINQTYVNDNPPAAPNVTVNKTIDSGNSGTTNIGNTTTYVPPPSTGGNTVAPKPSPTTSVKYITYTVHAGDTLQSLAKKYGVTVEQIASAPGNVYVAGEVPGNKKVGQQLGTGAGLKTGMTLHIPQYTTTG